MEQVEDPDRGRPSSCPQCRSKERLKAHGFYSRTIVDEAFDGLIRIRRYLCQACLRTVSLLPEWALPFMRFRRQDGESPLDGEPGLAGGSADSALPAGAALGAPFRETGRAVVGGAVGIDGCERSAEFYIQSA